MGPSGTLATEPGYAWLDGDQLRVGPDALRAASLQPRRVYNRFWAELDQAPIQRSDARTVTHADLAYAQLSQLWESLGREAKDALFVVPGSMQRQQLALLLGIARAIGIPVRGLVDAAVASAPRPFPEARLVHWDVGLHAAWLSELRQDDGVERGDFEALPKLGLASLREAQVASIARSFVDQARFDPLHDAGGEQALHERLPEIVAALAHVRSARIELAHTGSSRVAEIRRADLARPATELYRALRERAERAASGPLVALVSHRLADLPGFHEAMAETPGLEILRLEPEAACRGALARLEQIPPGEAGHKRIRRLAWEGAEPASSTPTAAAPATVPPPTHVVFRGLAHRLRGSFELGSEPPSGPGLQIVAEDGNVAARHCTLLRGGKGEVRVEVREGARTFVNAVPVEGHTPLHAGDTLRLGDPGVDLQLVAVQDSDGA